MRPKVVILTLVMAFALLAGMILLKGVKRGANANAVQPTDDLAATAQPQNSSGNAATDQVMTSLNPTSQKPLDTNAAAALAEQARTAEVERQLDEIKALLSEADGSNNATVTIPALLGKMAHQESDVRSAALDALRQLNDTNAVPGLQQTAENVKNVREKVAILDAIEYLKMPSITDDASPESAIRTDFNTNRLTRQMLSETNFNPNFIKGKPNGPVRNRVRNTAQP